MLLHPSVVQAKKPNRFKKTKYEIYINIQPNILQQVKKGIDLNVIYCSLQEFLQLIYYNHGNT
jgi:hypothetical protein